MTAPVLRYPSNPVTPAGAYHFLNGTSPRVRLTAFDGSAIFEIMGGGSIPDRHVSPECVRLAAPPKGVAGAWKMVDQQGEIGRAHV